MTGTIYAVGIGPGDPELLTLKAVRVIGSCPVLCVPKGREEGASLALSIVRQAVALDGKEIMEVHFPMRKGSQREALRPAAREIVGVLAQGRDVAFPTLGDPAIYSTFFHLLDAVHQVDEGVRAEIVPGVSSFTAAAARAGLSLALSGERLAVVPATYLRELRRFFAEFDAVVLMKVHRVLDEVRAALAAEGLLDRALYVARAGRADELIKPVAAVTAGDLDYFSLILVRKPHA